MKHRILTLALIASAIPAVGKSPYSRPSKKVPRSKKNNRNVEYTTKQFNLDSKKIGLTDTQLNEHKKLYEGYVSQRNKIREKLAKISSDDTPNTTYSQRRSLEVAKVFASNAAILHELYFENITGRDTVIGTETKNLIEQSFGSLDAYLKDLIACARCARGWVITGYSLDDGLVHNFVLDAHHETVPILVLPLVVIDVYEHAYMIDFYTNRPRYLETIVPDINWNVVESRVNKWVKKITG